MSIESPKLQPHQVYHIGKKSLGVAVMSSIFGRSSRAAYDWAQDPLFTEKRCRNPLETHHAYFQALDMHGYGYVAQAAINYLQTALDPTDLPPVKETLPTIEQEVLADYKAVSALQKGIENCEEVDLVETLVQEAKDEIDRTFAKYLKDCGYKGA